MDPRSDKVTDGASDGAAPRPRPLDRFIAEENTVPPASAHEATGLDWLYAFLHEAPTESMTDWLNGLPSAFLIGSSYPSGARVRSSAFAWVRDAKDFYETENKMTLDEAMACCVWTMDVPKLYSGMCALMRRGDAQSLEDLRPYRTWLWYLMAGLKKLPDYNGVACRAQRDKVHVDELMPGVPVVSFHASLTSCTMRPTEAQLRQFGTKVSQTIRINGTWLVLDVRGAKRLGPLSVYPDEEEVVLLPGWRGTVARQFTQDNRKAFGDLLQLGLRNFTIAEVIQDGVEAAASDVPLFVAHSLHECEQRLQRNPRDSTAQLRIAFLFAAMGKYREARERYESLLSLDPDDLEAHHNLAMLVWKHCGSPEDARRHFERALALDSTNAAVHNHFANYLKQRGDLHAAEQHFHQALKLDPKNASAHCNYALLLADGGFIQEASCHYRAALSEDPNDDNIHTNFAVFLHTKAASDEEAVQHFDTAIQLNPSSAWEHGSYAVLLQKLGRVDDAKRHYETSLGIDNEQSEVHANFAALLRDNFNAFDASKTHFERALNLDPDNATIYDGFATLLSTRVSLRNEARYHFERSLALDSERFSTHMNFACFLAKHKIIADVKTARDHFKEALRLNPRSASAHANFATFLADYNEVDEATAHFTEALAIDRGNGATHNAFARLLVKQRRFEQAKRHLEIAVEITPNDASAHDALGTVYFAEHQKDKAKECFETAVALDPRYVVAHQHLGIFWKGVDDAASNHHFTIAAQLSGQDEPFSSPGPNTPAT